MAGPEGEPGEESFDVVVCSPRWLERLLTDSPFLSGRHYLFMKRLDWPTLEQYVHSEVEKCTGETWTEVAARLARLGHWEFEDYVEWTGPI